MKKFYLILLVCLPILLNAQNCPQSSCHISVSVAQDSCPLSPQTLILSVTNSIRTCAADVPSAPIPNQTASNYCTTSDPSDATNCPASSWRAAHIIAPAGVATSITSTSIQSVYFKLIDTTLLSHYDYTNTYNASTTYPKAVGADFKIWLKSPSGTYLLLNSDRPFNSDYSTAAGNYCYCPTFTPSGSDGVLGLFDASVYNLCNYTPEGAGSFSVFGTQTAVGTWTLYVSDVVAAGGMSHGGAKIADFCMDFETGASTHTSYAWSSDSVSWLSYLSNLNSATPVFTPPAGNYNITYYVSVYDSAFGCVGTDTVHLSCPSAIGIESLSNSKNNFTVFVNNSEVTFHYSSVLTSKEIVVNDMNGKEIVRYALPQWSTTQTVKLPKMAGGVYVARLTEDGVEGNVKFVIE